MWSPFSYFCSVGMIKDTKFITELIMQTTEHRVTHITSYKEGRGGGMFKEIVEGAIDKHFMVLPLHLILVSLPFFKSTVNRWTSGFLGSKIADLYVFDTIFHLTPPPLQ